VEWQTSIPEDGRKVGVVVHHVVAQTLAAGKPVTGVTMDDVDAINADAPLTRQFMLEDHAVRHSYHHLARIRRALKR